MVDKIKKYTKKYFLLLTASIFSVMLFACLFDEGTITRVDKSEIHSDPHRFPVQLVKKDKRFSIEMTNSTKNYKYAKQIELALGTNGKNNIHAYVVFKTAKAGTFYFKGRINDNEYICLQKGPESEKFKSNTLYVTSSGLKNCALWTTTSKNKILHNWTIESQAVIYYPFVYFVDHPKRAYKVYEKIAYLWDIKPRSLIFAICVIIIMILLSSWKIQKGKIKYFALIIFSLMILISLVFPPFKHADEPQHILSYLDITGQSDELTNLENLAKKTHFSRILFNPDEKFTSVDLKNTSDYTFPKSVRSSKMEERSLITPLYWKLSKSFFKSYQLEHQILLLRLVNSIIFSACIFYIINKKFFNSIILICSIPTLLCISNSISNYIFCFCILILILFLILKKIINQSDLLDPIHAFLVSILTFETMSCLFLIPLLILFIKNCKNSYKIIFYYITFTSLIYLLFGKSFAGKINQIYHNNLHIFCIFIFCIIFSYFLDYKFSKIKIQIPPTYISYTKLILILFILSNILPNFTTNDIEHTETKFIDFIGSHIAVFLTWFNLFNSDYLTQVTLFSGFGWLDFEKNSLSIFINIYIFLMIPFTSFDESNKFEFNFKIRIFLYLSISIFLLLTSLYIKSVNPHGRYYICYFIVLIFTLSLFLAKPRRFNYNQSTILNIFIFVFFIIQNYTFMLIINRYY